VPAEAAETAITHILGADLDEIELDALIKQVAQQSGVGVRALRQTLKARRAERATQNREAARAEAQVHRTDRRPRLPAPLGDAPWLPEMDVLNDVLGRASDRLPPARRLEGQFAEVATIPAVGMHLFTSANAEEDDGGGQEQEEAAETVPEQAVIKTLSGCEAAEMIERHIEHYDAEDERPVHYPSNFVGHYMTRTDRALPHLVAINTLPLVLPHRELWAPDGLDREHGTAFLIDQAIRDLMPRHPPSREDIGPMMRFLCETWLADVAADFAGKCVLVSSAMAIIERTLFDDRPVYVVTAGKRGTGKTTTLKMIIEAVIGARAIAAAWSPNDEERRKALLAYLMQGLAYILWDNIKRNTAISCPHIEKACTAAQYTDRELGFTKTLVAALLDHTFFH
jgi:hypothetical protein